ncbi:DNA recombination protein RmuC [Halothiobacillus sp. DCM-1]|uniref:DNA recombination protein RmuC n=1 Tax=Halothiobacillus sp. DCM-1 TaxID=3112558 RepID=UPI00324E38A0
MAAHPLLASWPGFAFLGWGLALLASLLCLVILWQGRVVRRQLVSELAALGAEHAARGAELQGQLARAQALAVELAGVQAALQAAEKLQAAQRSQFEAALNKAEETEAALRAAWQDAAQRQVELQERLVQEQRAAAEKLALLDQAKTQLQQAFQALSADALRANNESFLKLAGENLARFHTQATEDLAQRQQAINQLTQPIRERLDAFDQKLGLLEQARTQAYSAVNQQINDLLQIHLPKLHRETADLVRALRQPQTRGRWGEVQLKRVVELAGMLEHCDFAEQVSQTGDGNRLRPDLIVQLPGGRQVVVDAKVPLQAYLQAMEAPSDEVRQAALLDHARQLRQHIAQLSKKEYFDQFSPTPEFVVLFVPGEVFFSAALMQSPDLIEFGAEKRVIPASPTTLIALLKAVAYGWRQEALAKNAQEMADLGRDLYERMGVLAGHWQKVGKHLDQAVQSFNLSVGSLEGRVLPAARKFRELGAVRSDKDALPTLEPLTTDTRPLTAPELSPPAADLHE